MKKLFLLLILIMAVFSVNAKCSPIRHDRAIGEANIDTVPKKAAQPGIYRLIVGNKMPRFVSTDINGNKVDLNLLKGKIVVLDFWFIGCPPCRYEIPFLNKITDEYKSNKDILFIAISNDKAAALHEFLKKESFKYQMIGDGQLLFDYYMVESCPLGLVIDKNGTIVFSSKGFGVATVPDRISEVLNKMK